MGWLKDMLTKAAVRYLNVQPAMQMQVTITEAYTFESNLMRNRLWFRGEPYELDQFFKNISSDPVNKARFWSATPSKDLSIRKIHSGLPEIIVNTLAGIVVADIDKLEIGGNDDNEVWDSIAEDNKFETLIEEAITEALVAGDGSFKISIDETISKYPIIEFYTAENVDYVYTRGRLQEIQFSNLYQNGSKTYRLIEYYGKGYVRYKLYDSYGKEVPLTTIQDTADLEDVAFKGNFIMGIPLMFFKSPKWDNRGKSIFDSKSDSFDALDEVISQWIDAIRDGRVVKYIPEDLVPKNDQTGELLKPNPFDNKFIKIGSSLQEDAKNEIDMKQADIKYEAYVESYSNAIDMCLQGIVSPSTLGIDLKKTDNAEAQREKEKATLYTRGKIVKVLTSVIPKLVETALMVNDTLNNKAPGEYEASISFGEYASPSFDNVVEIVGKAKSYGVMSVEKAVEEMYGDTMTDKDKALEVQRIKEQNGDMQAEEPKVIDTNQDLNNNGDINE
ncbi:phage portal protein [Clostridium saccharoperbutylacetonicum]|uniref:phage portal protein n=1 Tax=Clostridium saccharoperbutylacetonicum TaxID=36745 RepID=UPI0039E9DFF5